MSDNDRPEPDNLAREHCALLNAYGSVQRRCSRLLDEQARQLRAQERELMRLRAAVIVRDSALLWAQQERAELEAALPGLPTRRALARRVDALVDRVQALLRERSAWMPRERSPWSQALPPVVYRQKAQP